MTRVSRVQVDRVMQTLQERDEEVAALEESLRLLADQHGGAQLPDNLSQSLVSFLRGGRADRNKCAAVCAALLPSALPCCRLS